MQTYTVKQVADILGYSTNSIYTFLKEKRIKGVRVGRGRFRISQEELNRLLHLAKKTTVVNPTAETAVMIAAGGKPAANPTISTLTQEFIPNELAADNQFAAHQINHATRITIPSLFDWFLGVASILLGCSMFLLNSFLEEYQIGNFLVYLNPIRITLIASGIGILVTDMMGKVKSRWDIFFHILLTVVYTLFAFILFLSGDYDGFTIIGLAAVVQIISMFIPIGNVASFSLFTSLTLLLTPLAFVLKTPSTMLSPVIETINKNDMMFVSIWFGAGLFVILFLWWSYYRLKVLFYSLLGFVVLALVTLAIFYASILSWGRAFFLLIMAISLLFAPLWSAMKIAKPKDRLIVFGGHGLVLLIFLSGIGVVRLVQNNTLSYIKEQLLSKVNYGNVLIRSSFESMVGTLESSAINPALSKAISENQQDILSGIARNIYEGNRNFRRVIILNADGQLKAIYPYVTLSQTDFSGTSYFQQAAQTKKTQTSDLLATSTAENNNTIVISTPIGSVATFSGVIVGSADLDYLGMRLQQIANGAKQEYFTVTDKNAKIVFHPDTNRINTTLSEDDPIRNTTAGVKSAQAYDHDGVYMVQAADTIPSLGWMIVIMQPLVVALALTNSTTFIIFFVLIASVVVLGAVIWFRTRIRPITDDTS